MLADSIELGFDIATSLTIIGAALSFLYSQRKSRRLSQVQFAVTNLQAFLTYVRQAYRDLEEIDFNFRRQLSKQGGTKERDPKDARKNIEPYWLEKEMDTAIICEQVISELDAQLRVYFPIFWPEDKVPDVLVQHKAILEGLRKAFVESVTAEEDITAKSGRILTIKMGLANLEIVVARQLEGIMKTI